MKKRRWWHWIIGPPRRWDIRTASNRANSRVASNVVLYLNGWDLHDCVAYDCSRGVAEVYRRDERGLVVSEGHLLTKIVCGQVSVAWKKAAK